MDQMAGIRLFYTGRACNFGYMQPRHQVRDLLHLLFVVNSPGRLYDAFHKGDFCGKLRDLRSACGGEDTFPYPFLKQLARFFSPENLSQESGQPFHWEEADKKVFTKYKKAFVSMLESLVNPFTVAVVLNREVLRDNIIALDDDKKVTISDFLKLI